MTTKFARKFAGILLGLVVMTGPAAAEDKVSIRLNWLLSGIHSVFYLGQAQGLYKAEGIDLSIGEGQGSARTVQVVATGGDTFGIADGGSVIAGATRGAPVQAVMGLMNESPYAISARADSVKTIKDFEGKVLAVTPGEASLALLPALWKANGVDGSKVRLLNVDGSGKLVAILQKQADGILSGLEGQVIILKQRGLEQTVLPFATLGANTEGLVIVASKKTIESNPDLVQRFVRATTKSIEAARANPDAAVEAAAKAKPDVDTKLMRAQLDVGLTLLYSPADKDQKIGRMVEGDWGRTLELAKQYQEVTTDLTPASFFTDRFVGK